MPIGIELSSGVAVGVPKPLDAKYGPYDSVALALSDLSTAIRHQGLTVGIKDGGSIVEYWFKDGVADANFVEKVVAANWNTLLNKPSTFPPAIHSHAISDVTNLQSSLDTKVGLKTYYSVVMNAGESSKSFSLPANETNIEVRVTGFAVPSGTMTINLAANAPTGSLVTIITDGWSAFNRLIVQVISSAVLVDETYADSQGSFDKIWYLQKRAGGWANISNDLIPKPNWSASSGSRNEILNKPSTFPPAAHVHQIGDVQNLEMTLTQLGDGLAGKQPSGNYATLESGRVPASQLPSYVDDVLEFASQATFPATGETGKIYVALDTNKIYRWSGSAYVEVSPSVGAPIASSSTPTTVGGTTAAVGTSDQYARADHKHAFVMADVNASQLRSHLNVQDGAEVNVNADWNATTGDAQILNKPSFNTGKTVYVDAGVGTDTRTGLSKYDASKPFLSIGAAVAASATGDTVYVRAGTYSVAATIPLNLKGNLHCETGTTVQVFTNVVAFSYSQNSLPINITGRADFLLLGGTAGVLRMPSGNAGTFVGFECNSIGGPDSVSGSLFDCAAGVLFVNIRTIVMTTTFTMSNALVFDVAGTGNVSATIPFVYCGRYLEAKSAASQLGMSEATAAARFNTDVWTLATYDNVIYYDNFAGSSSQTLGGKTTAVGGGVWQVPVDDAIKADGSFAGTGQKWLNWIPRNGNVYELKVTINQTSGNWAGLCFKPAGGPPPTGNPIWAGFGPSGVGTMLDVDESWPNVGGIGNNGSGTYMIRLDTTGDNGSGGGWKTTYFFNGVQKGSTHTWATNPAIDGVGIVCYDNGVTSTGSFSNFELKNTAAGINITSITSNLRIVNYNHANVGMAFNWKENAVEEAHVLNSVKWSSTSGLSNMTFNSTSASATKKTIVLRGPNIFKNASISLSASMPIDVVVQNSYSTAPANANVTFKVGSFTVDPLVGKM